MERNAWQVALDIALHIDDVPVVSFHNLGICNREGGGSIFLFCFVFFQQDPTNHDYMKASESSKNMSPAIIILLKFVAELYMEFVKDTCKVKKERQCTLCENGWLAL